MRDENPPVRTVCTACSDSVPWQCTEGVVTSIPSSCRVGHAKKRRALRARHGPTTGHHRTTISMCACVHVALTQANGRPLSLAEPRPLMKAPLFSAFGLWEAGLLSCAYVASPSDVKLPRPKPLATFTMARARGKEQGQKEIVGAEEGGKWRFYQNLKIGRCNEEWNRFIFDILVDQ